MTPSLNEASQTPEKKGGKGGGTRRKERSKRLSGNVRDKSLKSPPRFGSNKGNSPTGQ